jgi:hypothetical protein
LKALGVGAATLAVPFARALRGSADPSRPTRFVTIFTPCGTIRDAWGTRRGDASFDLGPILAPFEALRDRVLVIDGLDMNAALLGPGGGHQRGPGVVLTGQPLLEGDFCGGLGCVSGRSGWAAGPSIDQAIADRLSGTTRLRSLELGVRVLGANNRHRISYRAANDPVPPDDDPFHVYERVFAGAGLAREALARKRRERASVLDLVRRDLSELEGRVGAEHRPRLHAHLESIREVERQLDAALATGTCLAPELGDRFDARASASYPIVSRLQLDLLATALACDATRVATVTYSGATSYQTFPWLGIGEQHHALSHDGDDNEASQRKLTLINAWFAEEIARFAARLASIPEGDGSVLDHTMIFWANEISKGNTHSHDDMLFLVIGGERAGVQPGRWLRFRSRPHADLLVSFARAMGHDLERFGHEEHCTGPLTETGIG